MIILDENCVFRSIREASLGAGEPSPLAYSPYLDGWLVDNRLGMNSLDGFFNGTDLGL